MRVGHCQHRHTYSGSKGRLQTSWPLLQWGVKCVIHVAGTSRQGGRELRRPSSGLKADVQPYVPVAQRTAGTQALATPPVTKPEAQVGSLQSHRTCPAVVAAHACRDWSWSCSCVGETQKWVLSAGCYCVSISYRCDTIIVKDGCSSNTSGLGAINTW